MESLLASFIRVQMEEAKRSTAPQQLRKQQQQKKTILQTINHNEKPESYVPDKRKR